MNRKTVSSAKVPKTTSVAASPSAGGGVASSRATSATPTSAGGRNRDRLGDPPGDDEREDGGEPVLIGLEVERDQQDEREQQRPDEQTHRPPSALEALLGG